MMKLSEIQGQDRAVSMLMKQLTSGRLAHAYLFLGPEGAGKTATALAFAKALVCGSEAGGCGVCHACRRADAGVHPDIHIIEHGEETSEIKVAQIRKLQEELSLTPFEAQKKAAVIDDAERLNPEASNAFLKTLEEPSRGTVLILTASDRKALLETLVSRCRLIRFQPLPDVAIRGILVSRGIDSESAEAASALAAGNLKHALAIADSGPAEDREWLLGRIDSLGNGNPVDLADELLSRCSGKNIAQTREGVAVYLGFMMLLARDVRAAQCGVEPVHYGASMEAIRKLSEMITERSAHGMLASIERCRREIAANVKPDLSLTRMFMNIAEALA